MAKASKNTRHFMLAHMLEIVSAINSVELLGL
jgi:hypothetical protein